MKNPESFNALVELALASNTDQNYMRPVIEKELLHYDILFALDKNHLLDLLTFQGGTSLRLCYGSPRYSEDLDFSGGKNFSRHEFLDIKNCLEKYVGERYGLDVSVKEPSEIEIKEHAIESVLVNRWQLSVTTAPHRKDIPKQRIKIEISNVPAYSRVPRALNKNYSFLPDGYSDLLVMTESMEEIMADKLVSLVNSIKYIRHRDIWDLRFLKQKNVSVNLEYVHAKILDYGIEDYLIKLNKLSQNLPGIIQGEAFKNEMLRFIPTETQNRTLKNQNFLYFLESEIQELLQMVRSSF
ncbi:MAG: nucleotidyl transferase AbiEii/AbiGii toxin family protein [Gammaproteobacteria bacterium]|nr:nucleotidyl transferase AbiEii/AbiGii toxin family protein [Gammaproteobacteria bacterium]